MNCYALMWAEFDREKLIKIIDSIPEIVNWRASSGGIFLASNKSDDWLSEKIHDLAPTLKTYLITKIDARHAQGYQDKATWEFITDPRPVGPAKTRKS